MKKNVFVIFLLITFFPSLSYAEKIPDPCEGLLALIDRPTIGNSPCAVKPGKILVESGMAYARIYPDHGNLFLFPQGELRFGLPLNNELIIATPDYINTHYPHLPKQTGYNATLLGLKHEFPYTEKWIYALEGLLTLPSGSPVFGEAGTGYTLNALITYNITPTFSFAPLFGISSVTTSSQAGAHRFFYFIPDLLVIWLLNPRLQVYAEAVGQTKVDYNRGWGTIGDFGAQFLLSKNVEVDFELGRRLSGNYINSFNYYGTCGGTIQF